MWGLEGGLSSRLVLTGAGRGPRKGGGGDGGQQQERHFERHLDGTSVGRGHLAGWCWCVGIGLELSSRWGLTGAGRGPREKGGG